MKKSVIALGLIALFLLAIHPVLAQDAQPASDMAKTMNEETMNQENMMNSEAAVPAVDSTQTNTENTGY
jgi:hypothetical protein